MFGRAVIANEIKFDGGAIDWRIVMAPDGKVAGVGIRKMP